MITEEEINGIERFFGRVGGEDWSPETYAQFLLQELGIGTGEEVEELIGRLDGNPEAQRALHGRANERHAYFTQHLSTEMVMEHVRNKLRAAFIKTASKQEETVLLYHF